MVTARGLPTAARRHDEDRMELHETMRDIAKLTLKAMDLTTRITEPQTPDGGRTA